MFIHRYCLRSPSHELHCCPSLVSDLTSPSPNEPTVITVSEVTRFGFVPFRSYWFQCHMEFSGRGFCKYSPKPSVRHSRRARWYHYSGYLIGIYHSAVWMLPLLRMKSLYRWLLSILEQVRWRRSGRMAERDVAVIPMPVCSSPDDGSSSFVYDLPIGTFDFVSALK